MSKRICAIHRFVEKKGLELLIKAGAEVAKLGVTIDIFGYGPLEEEYRSIIKELAINNVRILGPLDNRDEVGKTLRKYDLFACPSIRVASGDMDGIPTSIVESMIAGVPVLTTGISGIPDLVEDGVTGIICDPTPGSIAEGITRFFSFSHERRQCIIRNAKKMAIKKHDAKRLTSLMTRVWESNKIDVIMIGWKNHREHQEVLDRLYRYTTLPFNVIVCANSNEDKDINIYKYYLDKYSNMELVVPGYNSYVGPGTNKAMDKGHGDICVYLCGKEGFILRHGWEYDIVRYMEDNPSIGIAGTLCYSPSYLTGKEYINIPLFGKFRNKHYAFENPNRVFKHVQGGLFALRRKMYQEIGGFSENVPHSYTDVEYSYYAESSGWGLGELPGVLSLFNKTRPGLDNRIDSDVFAIHPGQLESVAEHEAIVQGKRYNCNICGWSGPEFKCRSDEALCPKCLSSPSDRKIFSWLAPSVYLNRRLPAIALGLGGEIQRLWRQQFQGPLYELNEFYKLLSQKKRLDNRSNTLKLGFLKITECVGLEVCVNEVYRLLESDADFIVQNSSELDNAKIIDFIIKAGFKFTSEFNKHSRSLKLDWRPLLVFRK